MAERKSTFSLELKGNAAPVARDTSEAVEQLTASITKNEQSLKAMSADLRRLRGSSAEVKAEKDKLKAAIAGTRQEISRDALELRKLGSTTADVAAKQKKLADEEKRLTEATRQSTEQRKKQGAAMRQTLSAIGGPASQASSKLEGLSTVAEGLGTAEGAAAIGAAAAAASILLVGGAAIAGAAKLTEFIISSQAASREMNLMRLAATGAEVNAANLGTQVDALAKKVPIAKTEINALGIELGRMGLRGQTIVDTMGAVAEAQGVGDQALASQLKELVSRGQMMNRFQLSPAELFGKNLRFDDIAGELAKSMNVGIDDARNALLQGTVPLEQGAAAMRAAVEKKFGGVNQALLLDPSKQVEKFEENLKSLTSGVNIEPILHDMQDFFALFDPEKSTSGAAIQQLVTSIGGDLVSALHGVAPEANDLTRNLVLGALKVDNAWLGLKVSFKQALAEATGGTDRLKISLTGLLGLLNPITAALEVMRSAKVVGSAVDKAHPGIVGGILQAITGAGPAGLLHAAGGQMADATSKGFTDKAEIHSPSRLFERHADNIVAGTTRGLEQGEGSVFDALNVMTGPIVKFGAPELGSGAPAPAASPAAGAPQINVTFKVGDERAARTLMAPSSQAQIKKTLAEVLLQAGFGVPA